METKDLLKSAKKKYPSHITTLNTITRAEICRPGVEFQQTFRFIASAAAPLGLRLVAGWIKPQWLTDELQHWGDMREMNMEQFKVKLALSTFNSSKKKKCNHQTFGFYLAKYYFWLMRRHQHLQHWVIYRSGVQGFVPTLHLFVFVKHFWKIV